MATRPARSCKSSNEKPHLGVLAMDFRGERDPKRRKAIAAEYGKTLQELIKNKNWSEMPGPEDQLPDEFMPEDFFTWLRASDAS
jgi:hypothetical protein